MLIELDGVRPTIEKDVFIAPTAVIIGDVTIRAGANIWFGAVVRGDAGPIVIGERVSVQDNVVIHVNEREPTVIEDDVLIGHGAILEGCHIGAGTMIGMRATVLSGVRIGACALIAAGSVVREYTQIPAEVLAAGVPAEIKGPLSPDLLERLRRGPLHYQENTARYRRSMRVITDEEST